MRKGETGGNHWMERFPTEYFCWRNMRRRCDRPTNKDYAYYGGRGISVDPRWDSFGNFLEDMGRCPDKYVLDRINTDGNYCRDNCRWVSKTVNQRNTRRANLITWQDRTQHIMDWAVELGIPYETLRSRVIRKKWDVDRAMTEPVRG